jgi:hypothetical protein
MVPLALAALPFVASGCVSARQQEDMKRARAVTTEFAAAHDARACNLLTGRALVKLYGVQLSQPVPVARARCVKRSTVFRGEQVRITDAQPIDDQTIKVTALSKDGTFTYSVTVRRPRNRWLVDDVSQSKVR